MSKINIIPLGGVRESGKNLYAVEVDEDIFVLDAGLKYPENEMLGIDVVIPDFTFLAENKDRVAGIFLTHGHADAIGALPYLLCEVNAPVFGSELTIELAKLIVENYAESKGFKEFHVVNEGTEIDFGTAEISFFKTTHTIPDSLGIQVKTPEGSIVYTGDFKFDQSAAPMYATDYARLAQIGSEKVIALLSDSSNAESAVTIASEREIADEVYETIRSWEGRIIVASVASNLARIQQVIDASYRVGRKIIMTGKDVERIVRTAIRLGKIVLPDEKILVNLKDIKKYSDQEILILETGRMGEPVKSLHRMAKGTHGQINIHEGDLVYIVTTPSIAMETTVARAENVIYRAGGMVKQINENLRVSGHANANDLMLMMNLIKPKNLIPIQGEYRQLAAHTTLAMDIGMTPEHTYICRRGDILGYDSKEERFFPEASTQADNVLIDGLGVGDVGNIVLRDRKVLSEDGILVVVATISRREGKIVSRPQVTSRGFVYQKNSRDILKESGNIASEVLAKHLDIDDFEWGKLKSDIRDALAKYLFEQTKRRPVILPVIMEGSPKNNR